VRFVTVVEEGNLALKAVDFKPRPYIGASGCVTIRTSRKGGKQMETT